MRPPYCGSHYFVMTYFNSQSKDIIDPVALWKSTFYGLLVFGLAFFSCEVGQRVSNMHEEIADRFDQLKWYLLPIKLQRLLPTIIINVNEPVVIECFGVLDGTREQFKKVKK